MTTGESGLSASELETWIMLVALFETIPAKIDAQLKEDAGVNLFEYTVLAMLSEEPDRTLQMTSLAAISFGSISRLSHAVSRLEKRGWVEKRVGSGSRRHNIVYLTDDGLEELMSVSVPHVANVRRLVVDPLTSEEVHDLARILKKLVGSADPKMLELLEEQIPEVVRRNIAASSTLVD